MSPEKKSETGEDTGIIPGTDSDPECPGVHVSYPGVFTGLENLKTENTRNSHMCKTVLTGLRQGIVSDHEEAFRTLATSFSLTGIITERQTTLESYSMLREDMFTP